MKNIIRMGLLLLSVLALLTGTMSVSAYTWKDGVLPENWSHIGSEEEITAQDILSPVNPNASAEARSLYAYLSTLSETDTFVAGQFDQPSNDDSMKTLLQEFGITPGLYSTRYRVNSTLYTSENTISDEAMAFLNVDAANAILKQHYDQGQILLIHADSAPRELCSQILLRSGRYEDASNGIRELDVTNPDRNMDAYALWMRYQENMIAALKKLEDSGVKAYMWRPWIEFNYHPFNGVDEEGYAAFVRVYQQTVDMMTGSGLTGFLVCYSPGCQSSTIQRYPGNSYVDTVGTTIYSLYQETGHLPASKFADYNWYVRTGKPIGLAEMSAGSPNNQLARSSFFVLLQDAMENFPQITWANCWDGGGYRAVDNNGGIYGNDDSLLYWDSPFVLTLEEIPDYRTKMFSAPGVAQLFATADGAGLYQGLEQRSYSAAELKQVGIDLTAVRAVRLNQMYAVTFYANENCTGSFRRYTGFSADIAASDAASFRSCKVELIGNLALNKPISASSNESGAWKANDGAMTQWSGELSDGQAWVMLDLEQPGDIRRYVVRNAGYAGSPDMYNTRDFQMQYSLDGVNWITVDTVTGNVNSVVDRSVSDFSARYVRLLITGANSSLFASDKNTTSIVEIELYGLYSEEKPVADTGHTGETPQPDTATETEVIADGHAVSDNGQTVTDDFIPAEDTGSDKMETDGSSGGKKKVQTVITEDYFPWWVWVLIAAGVVLVAGGTVVIVRIILRRKKATS